MSTTFITIILFASMILSSLLLFFFKSTYINYVDTKIQKEFKHVRANIELLESFDRSRKHYSNHGHE